MKGGRSKPPGPSCWVVAPALLVGQLLKTLLILEHIVDLHQLHRCIIGSNDARLDDLVAGYADIFQWF